MGLGHLPPDNVRDDEARRHHRGRYSQRWCWSPDNMSPRICSDAIPVQAGVEPFPRTGQTEVQSQVWRVSTTVEKNQVRASLRNATVRPWEDPFQRKVLPLLLDRLDINGLGAARLFLDLEGNFLAFPKGIAAFHF